MTQAEATELRKLDIQIAKVLGVNVHIDEYHSAGGRDPVWVCDAPHFSTNLGTACRLGEEAKRLGIATEYGILLQNAACKEDPKTFDECGMAFSVAHASPVVRCRAFLEAYSRHAAKE